MKFADENFSGAQGSTEFVGESYLASVSPSIPPSSTTANLAYTAELETDFDSGEIQCADPRAYAAKFKTYNADNPSFNIAISGKHAHEWQKAMVMEVKGILKKKTWTSIPRKDVPKDTPVLPGTWAFKLKRLPDGSPLKFKAKYCVRGDKQVEGVDYFETYAPVVQWSTIILVLTMVLDNGWVTKQVDYTNAFAQATLNEKVYIEQPKGFARKDKQNLVLKLIKSLYGLKQAPKSCFDKISSGLRERGFVQSELDPCLCLKKDLICVIHVDDTILAGPNPVALDDLITDLGISSDEHCHSFDLRDEGEVGDFLGIHIEKTGSWKFLLTQTGLISKVIKEARMEDCNPVKTPALTVPLHKDTEGELFQEEWDYATVVGMLL